jgi:hypothetical protein
MVLGAYMQPPTRAMESVRVGGVRRWHLRSRLVHDGLLGALRHSGRRLSDVRGLTICGHIEGLLVRIQPEEPIFSTTYVDSPFCGLANFWPILTKASAAANDSYFANPLNL